MGTAGTWCAFFATYSLAQGHNSKNIEKSTYQDSWNEARWLDIMSCNSHWATISHTLVSFQNHFWNRAALRQYRFNKPFPCIQAAAFAPLRFCLEKKIVSRLFLISFCDASLPQVVKLCQILKNRPPPHIIPDTSGSKWWCA